MSNYQDDNEIQENWDLCEEDDHDRWMEQSEDDFYDHLTQADYRE